NIKNCIKTKTAINNNIHKIIMDQLHEFMLVGGMPEVVKNYLLNNTNEMNSIKNQIMDGYERDFVKYTNSNIDKIKIIKLYQRMGDLFSKENKKFIISNIDKNARYINYENAITSLINTNTIYKINNINSFSSPLKSKTLESHFKLYYNDLGFISSVYNLNKLIIQKEGYKNIRGGLAENFIVCELAQKISQNNIHYYTYNDGSNNNYEIDFCIEDTVGNIIPIEVKYGDKFETKSINNLRRQYPNITPIIFSAKNFEIDNINLFLPLYYVGFLKYEDNRIDFNSLK
ncbi:MAG: DUF4143 domain-containing protein, partial [Mycoplasma sp.]